MLCIVGLTVFLVYDVNAMGVAKRSVVMLRTISVRNPLYRKLHRCHEWCEAIRRSHRDFCHSHRLDRHETLLVARTTIVSILGNICVSGNGLVAMNSPFGQHPCCDVALELWFSVT